MSLDYNPELGSSCLHFPDFSAFHVKAYLKVIAAQT